jgi:phosphoglycolate phosphatase
MLIKRLIRKFSASVRPPLTSVVFDKDGTLIDADKSWSPLLKKVTSMYFSDLGIESSSVTEKKRLYDILGYDELTESFHSNSPFMLASNEHVYKLMADNGFDPTSFSSYMKTQMSVDFYPVHLANLKQLFNSLRALGLKIAILSADDRINIERFLADAELDIDVVVSGDDGKGCKPSGEPLEFVAEALNEDVSSLLMVGDSSHDIDCGIDAGAYTAGVLSGVGDANLLRNADFLIDSVDQLPDLLLQNYADLCLLNKEYY